MNSRWWYLDLAADYPELEIYTGHGWGPDQELGLIELGDRVMTAEAMWLFTRIYSGERDRHWAAVMLMFGMVLDRICRERTEGEKILCVLAGEDPLVVSTSEIPPGWTPDAAAWDAGRFA